MDRKNYIESVSIIHPNCCGMDIHKNKISCCLIYEQKNEVCVEIKEVTAFTDDLLRLYAVQGLRLKERVRRCVGIPVSIGIGRAKTLAKVATSVAKKYTGYDGVFDLENCTSQDQVLASIKVNKVWGIGRRSTTKLQRHGIQTALDLKNCDSRWVRKVLGLPGLRTVIELRGESCIPIEQCPANRKSIVSSRSFRKPVTELTDLKEAVSSYISIAARKLRDQGLASSNLHVFLSTSRFRTDIPQFSGSRMITLPQATSCTPTLIKAGLQELTALYKQGYQYNKAGVMLTELSNAALHQQHLFVQSEDSRNKPLIGSTIAGAGTPCDMVPRA